VMYKLSPLASWIGSWMSETLTNISSMPPSRATAGAISASGSAVSTVAEMIAILRP